MASNLIGEKVSNLARNTLNKSGSITQTERLFSTRARYGALSQLESEGNLRTDRGQWAYIKLLTSQTQYREYVSGTTSREITYSGLVGSNSDVAVMATTGEPSASAVRGYDKFLLTGVSCSMNEKVQITEVFGDNEVVYYFGRQPMIFNFSGVLIDSPDNSWFSRWLEMYSEFLRGSQTAKNYELIKIVLPNMEITGTISGFSWQQDSNRDTDIPFTFQFIAKVIKPIAATGSGMITSNSLKSVNFSGAYSFVSQSNINSFKGQLNSLTKIIQNPTSSLRDKSSALSALGSGLGGTFGSLLNSGKNTLNGIQSTVEGWSKASNSFFNSVKSSAMYQTVTSSLNGIRTNLFSPIYGILSSLTKLVSNTANSATKLFNGLITPVRNILRDIKNISDQAVALVNMVNSSIKGFGRNVVGQIQGVKSDFQAAIKSLKKAAGAIGSSPKSVSHTISHMFSEGYITSGSPFLKTTPKLTFNRPSLNVSGIPPKSKVALLKGVTKYAPQTANSL